MQYILLRYNRFLVSHYQYVWIINIKNLYFTHVDGCETDLANDTGAPTISPKI